MGNHAACWLKENRKIFYVMLAYAIGIVLLWLISDDAWKAFPEKRRLLFSLAGLALLYKLSGCQAASAAVFAMMAGSYLLPVGIKMALGMAAPFTETAYAISAGVFLLCVFVPFLDIARGGYNKYLLAS